MAELAKYIKAYGWYHKVLAESDDLGLLLEPYPNEHSARLQDPGKYDKFRRTSGGKLYGDKISVPSNVSVIWGHPTGQPPKRWIPQALRFPTSSWTADTAKKWLADNKIKYRSFEAAKKTVKEWTMKLGQLAEASRILNKLKEQAVSNKSWASVDKSKLPASCFLWVEDPEKKTTWHLPYREGAGGIDSDTGMYKSAGPINIGAVRAIMAALGGARTGKAMSVPATVKTKAENLAKRLKIGQYAKK